MRLEEQARQFIDKPFSATIRFGEICLERIGVRVGGNKGESKTSIKEELNNVRNQSISIRSLCFDTDGKA